MKRIIPALLACLLLLGLTACFGGGGDNPATTTEPTEENFATQPIEVERTTQPPEPEYTTQVVEVITDPGFDATALFKRLEGVWDHTYQNPEGNPIPGFTSFLYDNGKPILHRGVYDGEAGGVGTLRGGRENEDGTVTLYFLYPATDDNLNGSLPERTDALQIDLANIDDGKLRTRLTTIWHTYDWEDNTYRCKTLREAGIRKTF
ncbi:MAG: hypothetical protein FWF60_01470 [Oscillospiraceae bacterium]|nr:hypothetical protein [Oscillospiraceae bacterium]